MHIVTREVVVNNHGGPSAAPEPRVPSVPLPRRRQRRQRESRIPRCDSGPATSVPESSFWRRLGRTGLRVSVRVGADWEPLRWVNRAGHACAPPLRGTCGGIVIHDMALLLAASLLAAS